MAAIYQGTYFTQTFIIKSAEVITPIDIANWSFRMHLRDSKDDVVPLLELTTGNGGIITLDGIAGSFYMVITAVQSLGLPLGTLVFDILRTNDPPGPVWLFGGRIKVRKPVTRNE